ncbi:WD40 repeat containing protein [Babesia gibsoni]|uniref:WD40 repeat containing protein n=1 Tax=Babesia gibsoni TaxID=33632 RepID=A0AAD8LSD6_BABGI|nr:WD40 repeat containing protein [Babesia gibsoni]
MESSSLVEVTPFSASYQLIRHIDSPSEGTRCGCILNRTQNDTTAENGGNAVDYEILVTGGVGGEIIVWRLMNDDSVDMVNAFVGHEGTVMDIISCNLAVSDVNNLKAEGVDGKDLDDSLMLYSCGRDRRIHRFNLDGLKLMTFVGHEDVVCSLHEVSNGKRLISGSWDGTAIIWDALTGVMEHRLRDYTYKYSVYCNSLPDGTVLTGMTNGDVCLWKNSTLERSVRSHSGVVRAISVKNGRILTCANDCSVRVYSEGMEPLLNIASAHENFVYDVRHSKNFPVFFTSSEDKTAGVWDLETGKLLQLLVTDSSIWKVVETSFRSVVLIPLNGSISLWRLDPTVVPVNHVMRTVNKNEAYNAAPKAMPRLEGSFEMTKFSKANAAKALEHLSAFNANKGAEVSISDKDIATIKAVLETDTVPDVDLAFVFKLLQWPDTEKVPVFDFLKVLLLNPSCNRLFKGRSAGFQIYNSICKAIKEANGNNPLITVSLQLMANMFELTLPRTVLLSHFEMTIETLNQGGAHYTKTVQQAYSVCMQNLIIASSDCINERVEKILQSIKLSLSVFSHAKNSDVWVSAVLLRHCKSLETILYLDNKSAPLVAKMQLLDTILDISARVLPTADNKTVEEAINNLKQGMN